MSPNRYLGRAEPRGPRRGSFRRLAVLLGVLWLALLGRQLGHQTEPRSPGVDGRPVLEGKDRVLLERLFSRDFPVRNPAEREFAALPVDRRASFAPALATRLEDPVWGFTAASDLGLCGQAALPLIEETLDLPNPVLRRRALQALSTLPVEPGDLALVTPILRRGLLDADAYVRQEAAHKASIRPELALALVGAMTGALRRTVAQIAATDSEVSREQAESLRYARLDLIRSLALCGPAARAAVPALLESLQECAPASPRAEEFCHRESIAALGAIRSGADRAVPALVEVLAEACCAKEAMEALASFGDGAVPFLASAGESSNAFVRAKASEVLVRLATEKANSALAALAAAETARIDRERRAQKSFLSLEEALAPIPPTPENPHSLSDVWSQALHVPGGPEVLIAAYRRSGIEAVPSFGPQRADLLQMFFKTREGYRPAYAQVESASGAAYAATAFSRAGRTFLHLVRKTQDDPLDHERPAWRLDRVFEVTGQSVTPRFVEPSPTSCGSWLPRLDETEALGVVFELGRRWRFGWRREARRAGGQGQEPQETRWLGELDLSKDGFVISRCNSAS